MVTVSLPEKNISFAVESGTLLIQALREQGIVVDAPCNGAGLCKKCAVRVNGEPKLACREVVECDVEVLLAPGDDRIQAVHSVIEDSGLPLCPDVTLRPLSLPHRESAIPWARALGCERDLARLRALGQAEALGAGPYTGLFYRGSLRALLPAQAQPPLGVAIDLGTTGLSACLLRLDTGEVLRAVSRLNPQCHSGGDVITRISYCMNEADGLLALQRAVLAELGDMVEELLRAAGFEFQNVFRIVVAGNNVMLHLFAGVSPQSIAHFPYRPVFCADLDITEPLLPMNPNGVITLLPSISGYVGADITAGLAAIGFCEKKGCSLFIDIGTNGEMVLNKRGKLYATSTAAGPALEGMNIDCGMRAVKGAIERVSAVEGELRFGTVLGGEACGLCGSGLIDLTAALLELGVVNAKGQLSRDDAHVRDHRYFLTQDIYLSQKDIRQLQLAKAAVAAGVELLLRAAELTYDELDEILIAGSFGYHLGAESLRRIGMLRPTYKGEIRFLGNTSLSGAVLFLRNKDVLTSLRTMCAEIQVVELAQTEEFQQVFVEQLGF